MLVAPFGQDDLGDLKSIFEVDHLRRNVVFLDIQCTLVCLSLPCPNETRTIDRMPTAIGNFISQHVYKNRLRSHHKIHERSACRFVDVRKGRERKQGVSWVVGPLDNFSKYAIQHLTRIPPLQNDEEVKIVVAIAKKFTAANKKFRVITPYDAQRNKLEQALMSAKLPWEDKCFNVDSFQGMGSCNLRLYFVPANESLSHNDIQVMRRTISSSLSFARIKWDS